MVIRKNNKVSLRFLLIGLLSFILGLTKSKAQIRFPMGNTLDLKTNNSVLYLETRILFTTGIFKSSDYRWEKVSDSLDSRWSISSCFNGDCKNDLLQSGQFIPDFGLNDTTCFIAFHVDCNEHNGKSVIKYNVFNTKSMTDFGTLVFNISYTNTSSIQSVNSIERFNIYPNPATNVLSISNLFNDKFELEIMDIQGKIIDSMRSDNNLISIVLDKDSYKPGLYFLKLTSNENSIIRKIRVD